MNYYHFIFRFDTDPREAKRSWEGFAESFSDALNDLYAYAGCLKSDLFSSIVILHKSEYLSVFK